MLLGNEKEQFHTTNKIRDARFEHLFFIPIFMKKKTKKQRFSELFETL